MEFHKLEYNILIAFVIHNPYEYRYSLIIICVVHIPKWSTDMVMLVCVNEVQVVIQYSYLVRSKLKYLPT